MFFCLPLHHCQPVDELNYINSELFSSGMMLQSPQESCWSWWGEKFRFNPSYFIYLVKKCKNVAQNMTGNLQHSNGGSKAETPCWEFDVAAASSLFPIGEELNDNLFVFWFGDFESLLHISASPQTVAGAAFTTTSMHSWRLHRQINKVNSI